jgi:hypothetical protein
MQVLHFPTVLLRLVSLNKCLLEYMTNASWTSMMHINSLTPNDLQKTSRSEPFKN